MLAVDTGVPRLLPLNGIFTAATPCETIKNPVSSFGGSLQIDPLPINPRNSEKNNFLKFLPRRFLFFRKNDGSDVVRREGLNVI